MNGCIHTWPKWHNGCEFHNVPYHNPPYHHRVCVISPYSSAPHTPLQFNVTADTFEMYFQMHRKLNWLMAKWMRLNGFRWAFLHTVKRLMMALVSFCKRIQCVNEIELVNKHRIYLSHHTTPHHTRNPFGLSISFCSRFYTQRSVEFGKLFETTASVIYNVWLLSMELNILANLRLNLIWCRSICRHYSRKFQSIFFNLILFRSLEFVRVAMVFFIEITTNNWFISDIKLNLVL